VYFSGCENRLIPRVYLSGCENSGLYLRVVIPVSLLVEKESLLCNSAFCGGFKRYFACFPFHCWADIPAPSPVSLLGTHPPVSLLGDTPRPWLLVSHILDIPGFP